MPAFKGRLLSEITFEHLERFLLRLAEKGLSPATRNRFTVLLSRLFERAKAYGYVDANPAKDLKRLREDEYPVPALSVEEQNALIAACHPKVQSLVLVALDTGCRKSELLRLEWNDVDLTRKELTVRKSKSGRSRIVPLTGRSAARLKAMRAARVLPMEGPDRVFAGISPSWPASTRLLVKKAAAAIGYPELRFHDLRHLCAVNLVRGGVPLPDVGGWLGHSPNSITVTMRYARHAPKDASQLARKLLEARIATG